MASMRTKIDRSQETNQYTKYTISKTFESLLGSKIDSRPTTSLHGWHPQCLQLAISLNLLVPVAFHTRLFPAKKTDPTAGVLGCLVVQEKMIHIYIYTLCSTCIYTYIYTIYIQSDKFVYVSYLHWWSSTYLYCSSELGQKYTTIHLRKSMHVWLLSFWQRMRKRCRDRNKMSKSLQDKKSATSIRLKLSSLHELRFQRSSDDMVLLIIPMSQNK